MNCKAGCRRLSSSLVVIDLGPVTTPHAEGWCTATGHAAARSVEEAAAAVGTVAVGARWVRIVQRDLDALSGMVARLSEHRDHTGEDGGVLALQEGYMFGLLELACYAIACKRSFGRFAGVILLAALTSK